MVFRTLTQEQLLFIVDIQVDYLRNGLEERGIRFEITSKAKEHLARQGYDPVYGARPLKRVIQKELETPIAKEIIKREVMDNSCLTADMEGEEITFTVEMIAKEEMEDKE